MSRIPELRELDPVATGLIRASLTRGQVRHGQEPSGQTWAAFSSFTMANLTGRVLAYACSSEAQAVVLLDNLINGLV